MSAWDTLKSFADGTTAHGVPRVVSGSRPSVLRIIWLLLWILAVGAFMYYANVMLNKLVNEQPTNRKSDLLVERPTPMPTITICDNNPLSMAFVNANASLHKNLQNILEASRLKNGSEGSLYKVQRDMQRSYVILPQNLREEASAKLESMVPTCYSGDRGFSSYQNFSVSNPHEPCIDEKLWTLLPSPQYGNCYSLNAGKDINMYFYEDLDNMAGMESVCKRMNPDDRTPICSWGEGPDGGIFLHLFTNPDDRVPLMSQSIGWKITITDPLDVPWVENSGISVSPGYSVELSLDRKQTKNIRNCFDNYSDVDSDIMEKLSTVYGKRHYTYGDCMNVCPLSKAIESTCHCIIGEAELIGVNKTTQLYDGWPKKWEEMNYCDFVVRNKKPECEVILEDQYTECTSKECLPLCTGREYSYSATRTEWPVDDDFLLDVLIEALKKKNFIDKTRTLTKNESVEIIRRSLSRVAIFYKSLAFTLDQEEYSYEFPDFVGDVGGVMGLLTGMSLLTWCEYLEFFAHLIASLFIRPSRKEGKISNRVAS